MSGRRRSREGAGGGRSWSRRLAAAAALLLASSLAPTPTARGQEAVSATLATGIELSAQSQQSLHRLEELWLQWFGAHLERDSEGTAALVDQLLATAGEIGLTRLPDLAFGALAQAVSAAREGDFEHARQVLAQADRLDPGRPETAFATADVARIEGQYLEAISALARGNLQLLSLPSMRRLVLMDAGLWGLFVLILAGGGFLLLQVITKGGALLRDAARVFSSFLPAVLAYLLGLAFLLWPLAVPFGPLVLFLYWSVLLWGYGSASERTVWIVLWLLLGLAPTVVVAGRQQVDLHLSPPVRAMESVDQGRLYGALFTDLGVLRSLLPENVAVKHFLGDLHRRLGQWDPARAFYLEVLESEPGNAQVLINLGAYYFYTGDFGTAVDYFRTAAAADPRDPAAPFNLSLAYSGEYYFDESQVALQQAREIDNLKVNQWLNRPEEQRILITEAGIARKGEIRRQLVVGGRSGGEGQGPRIELLRRGLSLLVAAGLVLTAVTLHLARRPFGYSDPPIDLRLSQGMAERMGRVLLPGLDSAEVGEGWRAYLAVLLPVALVMLPLGGSMVFRLPLGYDGGRTLAWWIAGLGLSLFFGIRLLREVRRA